MDRQRRDYRYNDRREYDEPDSYHEGYYDNPSYMSKFFWQGPGIRYPSTFRAPYMKESHHDMFRRRSFDGRSDSEFSDQSKRRKYVLAAIIAVAVLLVLAVFGAVLATTLANSDKSDTPTTVEKIVRKGFDGQVTFASKNWTDALYNKTSPEYKETELDFISNMDAQFSDGENAEKYDHTEVTGFEEGSVKVLFVVVWKFIVFVDVTIVDDGNNVLEASIVDIQADQVTILQTVSNIPEFLAPFISDVNECDSNPCDNGGACINGVGKFTCTCMPGYTGATCAIGIDECESGPCQHNGICTDQLNGYRCTCFTGIRGANCEINIDECNSNPCQNAGTCVDGINQYTCNCIAGYEGDNCEIDIDDCDPSLCQNEAACIDDINDYNCTCEIGWTGKNCEINIDDCNPNPCQNGASCTDALNEYMCTCVDGWTGKNCDTNIDDCNPNPCQNEATCTDDVNEYTCTCEAGWTGKNCDTDIDYCNPNPCKNGAACADALSGFTCTCVTGWTGNDCSTYIGDCDPNPCENEATCTDTTNDYMCTCKAGWTGKNCETDIDDCNPNPCKNGVTCTDAVNDYTCTCDIGWTGKNCQNYIGNCFPNPCTNGATCSEDVNDYTCTCETGWTGNNCGTNIDDCYINPCQNEAACIDAVNDYTCTCETGWTGKNCEINIDECDPKPCKNGATCTDVVNGYTCTCEIGWAGITCDTNIDDCAQNPCMHGAVCTDAVNDYSCACVPGYAGKNCDTNINDCDPTPCKNGATCLDDINDYFCVCEPGWAGNDCEINLDDCIGTNCNHGVCVDEINYFSCDCIAGYTGELCDLDIDECQSSDSPCHNLATCQNLEGTFLCICASGWAGTACELNINECQLDAGLCRNGATCLDNDGSYTCMCSEGWKGPICDIDIDECELGITPCKNGATCLDTDGSYTCICSGGWEGQTCEIAVTSTVTTSSSRASTRSSTSSSSSSSTETTTASTSTTTKGTTNGIQCNSNEVLCYSGTQCIPDYYWCDLYIDCYDNSDEDYCPTAPPPTTPCPQERCESGECYDSDRKCDGTNDCPDGSDEQDCPLVCLEDQFKCKREEQCVNVTQLCDGTKDCQDGTDEWYNCPDQTTPSIKLLELEVRLMDGENDTTEQLYGRVEVRPLNHGEPAGEFGTICSDSWDSREAEVLCRFLNASDDGQHFAYGNALFGQGTGEVLFRNFHCKGDEGKLEDCTSSGLGSAHCSHLQDAAISCGVNRHATESTTTKSSTVTSTTSPATTTTAAPDTNIRLVDGDDCLEGRIEFKYEGEWSTVCDDNFYSYEAISVCKTLGFSSFATYRTQFGPGTGPIYHLYCSYSHKTIWDCPKGEATSCDHSEDQGVRCAGDPDVLCKIEPGIPSVNCSFNNDICAYNLTKISGDVAWKWKKALKVGLADPENVEDGRVIIYENSQGSETDSVRMESPSFSPTAEDMKVEFSYQVHESSYRNLMFSLNEIRDGADNEEFELWNSVYLYRDQEDQWLYECVQLNTLNQLSNYSLIFSAMRGTYINSVTAVDGIRVTNGLCAESLLDNMCDFDRVRNCGMTVECSTCDRTKWDYTWIWQHSTEYSQINSDGYFMLADSSLGTGGDKTVLSFAVPTVGDKTVLKFWSYMSGEQGGSLEVQLYEDGSWHSTIAQLNDDYGHKWVRQCFPLPSGVDVTVSIKIKFIAERGNNRRADIAVDNVELDTGDCPSNANTTTSTSASPTVTSSEPSTESTREVTTQTTKGPSPETTKSPCNADDANQFRCFSGNVSCIPSNLFCDGTDNCDDSSDELNCSTISTHPIGCVEQLSQCGWLMDRNDEFQWTFEEDSSSGSSYADIIRLVDGPNPSSGTVEVFHEGEWGRVCDDSFGEDDAKVICRMLGYPTEFVDYKLYSYYGGGNQRIWLDDLDCTGNEQTIYNCDHPGWGVENCGNSEHTAVFCYGEASVKVPGFEKNFFVLKDLGTKSASWASLSSREFDHEAEDSRFLFEYQKAKDGVLQIWYHSSTEDQTQVIDKIIDESEFGQFCVDIPADLNGQISLGITAFKMSTEAVKGAVKNFAFISGSCKESLAKRKFTFEESDYRLSGYNVIPLPADGNCEPFNGWSRVLASTNERMKIDYTYMNETGHFMYANSPSSSSELQMDPLTEDESLEFCSLTFEYFTLDETADNGGLFVNVNDIRKEFTGIPKVMKWFPGCIELVDTCGAGPGPLDIRFEVVDRMAGIDDIGLSSDPCPEPEDSSVACKFWKGETCGYYMDSSAWKHTADGNLTTSAEAPGGFLISQQFDVLTNSCVVAGVGEISKHTAQMMVVDSNGETVASTGPVVIDQSSHRKLYLDVTPGTGVRVYFDAHSDNWNNELKLYYINVTDTPCEYSGLSCNDGDHRCGDICISDSMFCDGVRQCADGSDEKCECNWSTFNCTSNDECIHPFLQCNDFNDCTDGSDEIGCGPSVSCTFSSSKRNCGYKLHNARMSGSDDALEMFSELAYIISPKVSIETESCLVIDLGQCDPSNIRISTDDGDMYFILYQGSTGTGNKRIALDIEAGDNMGFVTETQSETPFADHEVTVTNIALFDSPCKDLPTTYRTTTSTSRRTEPSTATTRTTTDSFNNNGTATATTSVTRILTTTARSTTMRLTTTLVEGLTNSSGTSTTTTTRVPLPDDFPAVQITDTGPATFGRSVDLTCKITYGPGYEMIMYWMRDSSLIISRGEDIMVGDEAQTKYEVNKSQENGRTIYNLTVTDVNEDDTTANFACIADVVGYPQGVWPNDETRINTEDDGCFAARNTGINTFCPSVGYNRVTVPTVSGLQTIDQVNQAMSTLQKDLDSFRSYSYYVESQHCLTRLHELACELHVSHCEAGAATMPLCREHCQEIAGVCMNHLFDIVSNFNTDLEHYCKYLPSIKDQPDCKEMWFGCGVNVTLGTETTSLAVRLRSENYPHASPSVAQCNFLIYASTYYALNLTTLDITLADDCTTNYLMVNGKKYCSGNASQLEQLSTETMFDITLVANIPELKSGFVLSVSQVLPAETCDVIEINNFDFRFYDAKNTKDDSCSEWLFYSNKEGHNIGLNFTVIDGCLQILDNDLNSIKELCNLQTVPELSTFDVIRIRSSVSFKLNYSLLLYSSPPDLVTYDFTIDKVELKDGTNKSEGKVFITRSDGRSGYMCGSMNDGAADVICKMAGFGRAFERMKYFVSSGYDYDKEVLLYDLSCHGEEDSFLECYKQEWEDSCDTACDCYLKSRYLGVACHPKSVSCIMDSSIACSYEYDTTYVLQAYTLRFGDGLYMTNHEGFAKNITSPDFTYFGDYTVSFEYSFDGSQGDSLELYIRTIDGTESVSIWKKFEYTLDGRFDACVQLPSNFINKRVQLEFEMSMMTSTASNIRTIGLHRVSVSYESCPEQFPGGDCSFNNVQACDLIFSQVCFGESTNHIWQIKDGSLTGDSTFAQQNTEYPLTFTIASSAGSYIYFDYSQTGTGVIGNDLRLLVKFESSTDGSEILFSDSKTRPEREMICSPLPETADETFNISFILTKRSSEGSIFLDDIAINDEPCRYVMPARLESFNTDLEPQSVFKTPLVSISEDTQYKCLSFFYKADYSTDEQYKLEVEVFYLDTNETVTSKVDLVVPYMWQEENIEIDSTISSKAQFSFMTSSLTGQENIPIEIQDISLLQTNCVGLQDLEQCDLSNPGLCGFEANCTSGSGYIWHVRNGSTGTQGTGPSTDADGAAAGYFLHVDSSLGEKDDASYIRFKVDPSDTSKAQQYQFFYHMSGDGTARLETSYWNAVTDTYSSSSVVENIAIDMWLQSYCYQLPENFKGEIYFYAVRGDSIYSDIAIDSISLLDGNCQNPSVACEYTDSKCGHIPVNSGWSLKGGFISTSSIGALRIPVQTLTEKSCIRFEFKCNVKNKLTLVIDTEHDQEWFHYTAYSEDTNVGQITYLTGDKRMTFFVPDDYVVRIDRVTVETGGCGILACEDDETACTWQCVPQSLACDRKWDCSDGTDELGCGFSIPCDFDGSNDCGYATVPGSSTKWTVKTTHSFNYNGSEQIVSGGMLFTSFKDTSSLKNTSASSTWHTINETKCVRFSYLGTAPSLTVTANNWDTSTQMQWTDPHGDMTPAHWRPSQFTLEPGKNMITFVSSMLPTGYTATPPNDAFVAISKIELLSGACDNYDPPDCPDETDSQCDNGSVCYNEEVKCDGKHYCSSGADESPDICSSEFKISCNFERSTICGWTMSTLSGTPWRWNSGYQYQNPPVDHTKNDTSGHCLRSVNWDNNHVYYERATVISPTQSFQEDGCITFWYYLNSTGTQPNALSAQILVSLIYTDSAKTEFLWYDYVDRQIDTWIQGGVQVLANHSVQMNVTSIKFETSTAYPGVVALDDVQYSSGKCGPKQECGKRSFACKDSGVCIPEDFICDGKEDCVDSSDEANCDDRPDGMLSISSGDGSYGHLRYFKDGSWRAVCKPSDDTEIFLTQWVCEQLGYKGNSEMFEYQLRDVPTEHVSLDCVSGSCTQTACSSSYGTIYVGIRCSNTACFSGERRCPSTDSLICVAKGKFCDGLPDCPNNSDERECYCNAEERRCTRTSDECSDDTCETCKDKGMFECQNHQCIDKNKQCDGRKDCSDGFDEYKCVRVTDNQVVLNNRSELLPVCYNSIGRSEANMLCALSGKGVVVNAGIDHGEERVHDGIILTENEATETFLPGLRMSSKTSCFPLKLRCELPECGTTVYKDNIVSPLIIHGDKAVPGEWPFQCLMREKGSGLCGCSWIGGRWAITASHCVEDATYSDLTLLFGSTSPENNGPYGQEINVAAMHMHPNYDRKEITDGYDIAILELAFPPNADDFTRPVCLGTKESLQEILDLGDQAECYITGYGGDELFIATGDFSMTDLTESKVGIVERDKCKEIYGTFDAVVSHDGLCLENRKPYHPSCSGDSGGPFVCKNKQGRWEQFGVSSYASLGCKYRIPSVYFDLTTQLEWIETKTGMNFATYLDDDPTK